MSDTVQEKNSRPLITPLVLMIVLGVLIVVVIAGFVTLVALGHDPSVLAYFLSGPAVSLLVGALLNVRTNQVDDKVTQVQAQTNGALSAQFGALSDRLDAVHAETLESLASASEQPSVQGTPSDQGKHSTN